MIYQPFIHLLFLTILVFIFTFISWLPIQPVDELFYLQTGLDWINKGWSPWVDHYSFTHYGQSIHSAPYIYEFLLAYSVKFFGFIVGFKVFLLLHFIVLIFAIYYFYQRIDAKFITLLLILPLLIYFILLRFNPRPELLSNALIVFSLTLYFKLKTHFTSKNLLIVSLLLLFWSNWHVPIFGYMIFFALFIDKFFDKVRNEDLSFSWHFWLLWGGIIFFIGFLNPDWQHFIFKTLKFMHQDWASIVYEFKPIEISYYNQIQLNLLWISTALCILFFSLKKQIGIIIIIIILVYFSLKMQRLLVPSAVIILLLLLYVLNHQDTKKFIKALSPLIKYFIALSIAGIIFYNLNISMNIYHVFSKEQSKSSIKDNFYPSEEINYLKDYKKSGNIFSNYGFGGVFIYYLSPQFKVFWDGRLNLLYPYSFAKKMIDYGDFASIFIHEVNDYSIDYIVLPNTSEYYLKLSQNKDYKIEYISERFLLFSKQLVSEKSGFHSTSKLALFPECWDKDINKLVVDEAAKNSKLILTKESRIYKLHQIVKNYAVYADSDDFYQKLDNYLVTNNARRLTGLIALKSGNYTKAFELFSSITVQTKNQLMIKGENNRDRLILSYLALKTNNFIFASKLLTILSSKIKSKQLNLSLLSESEKEILVQLYEKYKHQLFLTQQSKKQIEEMKIEFKSDKPNEISLSSALFSRPDCHHLFF